MGTRNRKIKVLIAFGTRPEAIKVAPLILALKKDPRFQVFSVLTGQHRQMVDQVLEIFRIKPDRDLDLMRDNQDLVSLSHRLLVRLQGILRGFRPDWVVVQGDTTTAFVVAWVAFYERIRVAHLEAGLRSHDPQRPFPEEINRRLISQVADLHFAPTASARKNLLGEGIPAWRIRVTGNTGIDSLLLCLRARRHGNVKVIARSVAVARNEVVARNKVTKQTITTSDTRRDPSRCSGQATQTITAPND